MKLSDFTSEQLAKLKQKCKGNLFYLGKSVIEKDFVESPHRAMCEFYVKKDPSFKTFKEFAQAYLGSRDRIQLVPRETYKSSIKVLDNVQWIICWPEIRIETVTSNKELSTAFIDELIAYFTVRGNSCRSPEDNLVYGGRPTLFQQLFPEHCVTESEANSGEFFTPARAYLPQNLLFKDPTAGTLSMEGATSGWHCDILDYDDPVSDRNAETSNQLEKLENRMAMIDELRMNYGFRHIVATRYHPLDPYGKLAEAHGINGLYGDFDSEGLKYMCRPCWWLKGQPYKQPDYKNWVPRELDLDLYFPEGSPFEALKKKFKNPTIFFSQQLNSPIEASAISFTDDLIRGCIIDHTALPKRGHIFVTWDFAWAAKNGSDYSVGAVGLLDDQRRWWVIDVIRGRFDFSERCFQVVNTMRIHRPRRTAIENALGAEQAMQEPLYRLSKTMNVELGIDWVNMGRGSYDAKYVRMSTMHPWMRDKRLLFLNTIPCMDDLVKEFKNIGPKKISGNMRNDIPDAVSRLVEQYSVAVPDRMHLSPEQAIQQWHEQTEREFSQMIFRKGKYAEPEPIMKPDYHLDSMTGLPSPYAI